MGYNLFKRRTAPAGGDSEFAATVVTPPPEMDAPGPGLLDAGIEASTAEPQAPDLLPFGPASDFSAESQPAAADPADPGPDDRPTPVSYTHLDVYKRQSGA